MLSVCSFFNHDFCSFSHSLIVSIIHFFAFLFVFIIKFLSFILVDSFFQSFLPKLYIIISMFNLAPPRFRSISSSTTIGYIGLDTKLACDIVGYPQPRVTWQRSNLLSISDPRFTVRMNTLTIQRTQKVDAGAYMCRGSNSLGTTLDMTTLKVQDVGK